VLDLGQIKLEIQDHIDEIVERRQGKAKELITRLEQTAKRTSIGSPSSALDLRDEVVEVCTSLRKLRVELEVAVPRAVIRGLDFLISGADDIAGLDSLEDCVSAARSWMDRAISGHQPLTDLALGDLLSELSSWCAAHGFDDDQDPALDTVEQRVVRAYGRWRALSGAGDGR
jgi:hypothetical protein